MKVKKLLDGDNEQTQPLWFFTSQFARELIEFLHTLSFFLANVVIYYIFSNYLELNLLIFILIALITFSILGRPINFLIMVFFISPLR